MSIFKGSGVAVVTPMHDSGEVNYEEFAKLLEFWKSIYLRKQ